MITGRIVEIFNVLLDILTIINKDIFHSRHMY